MSDPRHKVPRKKQRDPATVETKLAARRARRQQLVAQVVEELAGDVTHHAVAASTGIPLEFLLWSYPTIEDLRQSRPRQSMPARESQQP